MKASEHGGASSPPGIVAGLAQCSGAPPPKDTDKTSNSRDPDGLWSCWLDSFEPWGFSFHPWKEVGQIFAKQLTLGFLLTFQYDIFDLEIKET